MDPQELFVVAQAIEAMDSSSSSSENEDDDELYDLENLLLLQCIYDEVIETESHAKIRKYVDEVVSLYSDADFKKHFRLERCTVSQLTTMFEGSEFCPVSSRMQGGGSKIFPAEDYLLVFLWFAGNKATYRDVADRFGIAESTVFKIINVVMDYLIHIAPTVIYFPTTTAAKRELADSFFQIAGIPDVLGCIDGSYIVTHKPVHKIRSTYINRHDGISVTLQGICDSRKRFLDVFTGVPSKIHDARVFKLSPISGRLENICEGIFHVLGDGAYELREWLLTPYRSYELLSRARKRYNERFCSTRVVIENAFGILKKRFIQLLCLYMWDVDRITKFIISCCVLHNICIDARDDAPNDDNYESDGYDVDNVGVNNNHDDENPVFDIGYTDRQLRQRGEIKRSDVCVGL